MPWLNNARILATFAVVLLHVSAIVMRSSELGTVQWWAGNFYDSLARWCVPVFVMISGALLLDPEKKDEELWVFYKKRLSRILIPLLFWSAFYLLWTYVKSFATGEVPALEVLAGNLLLGRPYFHLWFFYMILALYLFAPFLRRIVASSTERELLFATCLLFCIASASEFYGALHPDASPGLVVAQMPYYIAYFVTGYLIQHRACRASGLVPYLIFALAAGATMLGYYWGELWHVLRDGKYFYGYLSVTVIPMSVSLFYLMQRWNSPIFGARASGWITPLTMGIYVIHPVILELFRFAKIGAMSHLTVVSVPLFTTLVFSLSMVGAWAISQIPYIRRTI